MAGTNVTARLHYDTSHNFYVQIQGRKKFVLLPPEAHLQTKLYPSLHARYRHGQISSSDLENLALRYPPPLPSLPSSVSLLVREVLDS